MGIERQKELKETKKGLPLSQAFPLCELRVDAAAQAMLIRCDGRKERKRKEKKGYPRMGNGCATCHPLIGQRT